MDIKDIKQIIVNLIILGQLDTGMKLNTRGDSFELDEYNWYQGFTRLIRRGEDRNITVKKIEILVKDTSVLVNSIISGETPEDIITLFKIREYIEQGITGLTKLKETYACDKTTWAKLGFEIESLEKLRATIPDSKKID